MLSWWKVTQTVLLLVALGMSVRSLYKEVGSNGVKVWNVERKSAARTAGILTIPLVIAVFGAPIEGLWGVLAAVAVVTLLIASVIAVIDLPSGKIGDWIDDIAWRKVKFFAVVVWAQIASALLYTLIGVVIWVAAVVGGGNSSATPSAYDAAPAGPVASVSASANTPSTIGSAKPSASPSVASVSDDSCTTPVLQAISKEAGFTANGVQTCKSGAWKAWSGSAPTTVLVTSWAEDGGYGYGRITVEGKSYLIRTTSYKSSSPAS